MSSGAHHYQKAEELLRLAESPNARIQQQAVIATLAQAHAMLAATAAMIDAAFMETGHAAPIRAWETMLDDSPLPDK